MLSIQAMASLALGATMMFESWGVYDAAAEPDGHPDSGQQDQ